jgi:hypothetical protein
MKWSEVKAVSPATVFAVFFSACFIIALIYCLSVNLGIAPRASAALIQSLRAKIDPLRPLPRSLAYAVLIGAAGGIGAAFLSLVYNIFASIVGGIKADLKE